MYLFNREELQQWENEMPVQKVGDFGGQIVFRHDGNGRGRASKPENFIYYAALKANAPSAGSAA